ncbi:MAG: DNA polymerase III subunit chi [Pseudomonadota bacterium]
MAAQVRFYQLQKLQVEDALPLLLEKALNQEKRCIVALREQARVRQLSKHLWGYSAQAFLPHGSQDDGEAARQPIWLADTDDNPNGAEILFAIDMFTPTDWGKFAMTCIVFSRRDREALVQARNWWRMLQGHDTQDLLFYEQDDQGRWQCAHQHQSKH